MYFQMSEEKILIVSLVTLTLMYNRNKLSIQYIFLNKCTLRQCFAYLIATFSLKKKGKTGPKHFFL